MARICRCGHDIALHDGPDGRCAALKTNLAMTRGGGICGCPEYRENGYQR